MTFVRPLRLIIVEDSLELLAGWEAIFSLDGHRVDGFGRGMDALRNRRALLGSDALICDYYLPDVNGLEVLRRARELRPDLPGILLTGARDTSLRDLAAGMGVDFLDKPVAFERLEATLVQALAGAGVTRGDEGPGERARVLTD